MALACSLMPLPLKNALALSSLFSGFRGTGESHRLQARTTRNDDGSKELYFHPLLFI